MKGSSKRALVILISVSLLIVSVTIYSYFIKPLYGEIYNLKTKEIGLSETYATYESLNNQFQNILEQYQNSGELQNQLSIILPSELNAPYALGQVIGIAKLNNLEIQTLTIKPLTIISAKNNSSDDLVKDIGTLRISARFSGTYENFKSFLKGIETNIMISNTSDFKIEGQSATPLLLFTGSIDTYYQ